MLMGVRESAPCGRPHRKLEPTDIILSSSHAKKLAFFCTRNSPSEGTLDTNRLWAQGTICYDCKKGMLLFLYIVVIDKAMYWSVWSQSNIN